MFNGGIADIEHTLKSVNQSRVQDGALFADIRKAWELYVHSILKQRDRLRPNFNRDTKAISRFDAYLAANSQDVIGKDGFEFSHRASYYLRASIDVLDALQEQGLVRPEDEDYLSLRRELSEQNPAQPDREPF